MLEAIRNLENDRMRKAKEKEFEDIERERK